MVMMMIIIMIMAITTITITITITTTTTTIIIRHLALACLLGSRGGAIAAGGACAHACRVADHDLCCGAGVAPQGLPEASDSQGAAASAPQCSADADG
jgi:hypothetical protein